MSQIILSVIAFVLALRPGWVAEKETKHPSWKWATLAVIAAVLGTGISQSMSSDDQLHRQIDTLYLQSKLEATKSDMQTLTDHMDSGLKSVVDAIKELCKPSKPIPVPQPTQATPTLPAPPHITVSQARALPSDPQFAYGVQVTIQSDQSVPVSFAIKCTGPIGAINAFLVGQGAYLSKLTEVRSLDTAIVRFGYPPLTPQSPLVVILSSKQNIRVVQVTPFEQ